MKYLAVLILGLATGYFLYPAFHFSPVVESKLSLEKSTKLQKFIDQEAKAFALLKDADAKLKAAEEMYGKMMILFLADLGLKSSHQFAPAEVVTSPEPVKHEIIREEKEAVIETSPIAIAPPVKKLTSIEQKNKDNDERYDKYRMAHYVESFDGKAKRLLGTFKGILRHQGSRLKGREDTVTMNFNLKQQGKNISGDTLIVMTDANHHEYSRNAGNGGNRALKSVPQDAESFYVDASPTSYFLINLKSYPQVSGKYFERGKLIGDVELRKMDGPI
ncbi:MAG: hypothetical protein H0V66_06765 [Bdellovibrionales bacterium]|nr:hypothetical protein [Bdellovibrionales bacterium]